MSGFADYLPEVFERFGTITLRRMFGGYGVYHQGLMFALVADDTLYLKTDTESRPLFERERLEPFVYTDKNGRTATLSYSRAPDDCLDDRDTAALWARRAWDAAVRAQAAATRKKRSPAAGRQSRRTSP